MLTAIVTAIGPILSGILKNPKLLIGALGLIFVLGIFIGGCLVGERWQQTEDETVIADLRDRIFQLEHAPVREYTERETIKAKPEPTKPLTVKGTPKPLSDQYQKRLDSLKVALGDTLSKLHELIAYLTMPYDSLTPPDTLKVDSLFSMPYRLLLAAQSPLDRLLAGILLPEPFEVHRDKLIRVVTLPPEPAERIWYEYVLLAVLAFLVGFSL